MGDELRYMGSAAVMRDMAFMVDVFDGEGAKMILQVNPWFPERIGYVRIDGALGPILWIPIVTLYHDAHGRRRVRGRGRLGARMHSEDLVHPRRIQQHLPIDINPHLAPATRELSLGCGTRGQSSRSATSQRRAQSRHSRIARVEAALSRSRAAAAGHCVSTTHMPTGLGPPLKERNSQSTPSPSTSIVSFPALLYAESEACVGAETTSDTAAGADGERKEDGVGRSVAAGNGYCISAVDGARTCPEVESPGVSTSPSRSPSTSIAAAGRLGAGSACGG
ncbi:hypothetical protein B0H13DRAFT_1905878 [Mycena leptocephala]|nr:hypothetical protein B0H13DRAFT_1905878 [Mycena leptocephala]